MVAVGEEIVFRDFSMIVVWGFPLVGEAGWCLSSENMHWVGTFLMRLERLRTPACWCAKRGRWWGMGCCAYRLLVASSCGPGWFLG